MRMLALLALGACGGAEVAAAPARAPATAPPEEYAAVQEYLARKRPAIFTCYANAMENRELGEKAEGQVQLALAVLPSGASENVRVASSTLKSKGVEACIVGLVAKWKLPAPSQRIELTYTYELKPE